MNNPKLLAEKQVIDNLFIDVNKASGDPYVQSLLTYYLCVRISGFLENCVRIIFTEYSRTRTKDYVSTYVAKRLEKFPNPTYSNICNLANDFNAHWKANFKANMPTQLQQSLESINVNRNAIAHGGNCTITVRELNNYYQDVLQMLDVLEQTCV